MKRVLSCKIFGCESTNGYACDRCGCDIYHWDFVQTEGAWLYPYYAVKWWFQTHRRWLGHKCEADQCCTYLFFTDDSCCSDECYQNWIPF